MGDLVSPIEVCPTCGLSFTKVDWIPWKVNGYCSLACHPLQPDGTYPFELKTYYGNEPVQGGLL